MRITNQRISQIIKEELARSRRMNEMMGRRGPEHTPGTPEHHYRQVLISSGIDPDEPEGKPSVGYPAPDYDFRGGYTPRRGSPHLAGEYAEYDSKHYGPGINELDGEVDEYAALSEGDDDMEMDGGDMTDIDVVADDAAPGDDMGGEDMMAAEMEAEIDWSQFAEEDAADVGAAFMDAIKQLREEMPEETPTAAAVVERMQEILMGDDEADDNAFMDTPATEAPLAEGVDWRRRAGLLAGITKRY